MWIDDERCESHGIWFDAGELERALELHPLPTAMPKFSVVELLLDAFITANREP